MTLLATPEPVEGKGTQGRIRVTLLPPQTEWCVQWNNDGKKKVSFHKTQVSYDSGSPRPLVAKTAVLATSSIHCFDIDLSVCTLLHQGVAMHTQWLSHVLTLCGPMDCNPTGFSVHGIFEARILQWVAISSSRESSWPRDQTCICCVFCIGRQILYHWATWEVSSGC